MKPSDYIRNGWCQGQFAALEDGTPCNPRDPDAKAMCAVWAIRTSCGNYDKSMQLQGKVEAALGIESLPEWNDAPGRTKEEVIAALESVGL